MSEGFALPHGGFRAPRVPFDLRCVILAAAGYLAICGVDLLLAEIWNVASPIGQLVSLLGDNLAVLSGAFGAAMKPLWGLEPYRLEWWKGLITAFAFLFVWSFFGAALLRTAAMKLTRDDPVSLKDGIKFGGGNFVTFLLAPVLVLAFAGLFTLLNMLFGLLMSVWGLGILLSIVLAPLSMICSLMVIVSIAGGLIGLPLMWAGISVEQNGALEAISRAFSYIFARPLQFFFGYFLVFVLMAVILVVGDHFDDVAKTTLKLGVARDDFDSMISRAPGDVDVLQEAYRDADRVRREAEGVSNLRNIGDASLWDVVPFALLWLFLNLFLLGFKGFAIYFFLGGTVSLYLHLRREVDGTDEREIYPESEEEFEAAEAADEPRWVAPDAPPEPEPEPDPEPEPPPPAPPKKKAAAKKKAKKKAVAKKKKKKAPRKKKPE